MQAAEGAAHRIATIFRKGLKLLVKIEQALALCRRELLKAFHAPDHFFPLLRRKLVEPPQTFHQALLAIGRQFLKIWLLLQHLFLFFRGQIVVFAEPLSRFAIAVGKLPLFRVVFAVSLRVRVTLRVRGRQHRSGDEDEYGGRSFHLQIITCVDGGIGGVKIIQ